MNGSLTRWAVGALLTLSLLFLGWAWVGSGNRIQANTDDIATHEIRIDGHQERLGVEEAHYAEIIRRLDRIESKLDGRTVLGE